MTSLCSQRWRGGQKRPKKAIILNVWPLEALWHVAICICEQSFLRINKMNSRNWQVWSKVGTSCVLVHNACAAKSESMECFHHIKVVCSSSLRCLQVRQAALLPGYSIMLRSTIVSASAVGLNATHCLKTTFSLALTLDFTLYSKNCRKSSMLFFDISIDTTDRHYVIE